MKKEFQIASDLAQVRRASEEVLSFLKPMALDEIVIFDVRLCVEEAVINAIKYGNRLNKNLKVKLGIEYDGDQIRFEVCDQGRGFEVSQLQDCTKEENLLKNCGRGIFLIQHLMDEVRYNDKGNCVVMVKRLAKDTKGCHTSS